MHALTSFLFGDLSLLLELTPQKKNENHLLIIRPNCKKECNLVIKAEDYARNKAPNVYWKIKVNGTETKITGPFSKMEE